MKKTLLGVIAFFVMYMSVSGQSARKIDEFSNLNCEEYLAHMDQAINEVTNDADSTMHILIYEGKEMRYRKGKSELAPPPRGSAAKQISTMRQYLSKKGLKANRFSFVKAGFKENSTIELWLVPKGTSSPAPTPTLNKIKYRTGKPVGFCTSCCG